MRQIMENYKINGRYSSYWCIRVWNYNYSHDEIETYERFHDENRIIKKVHMIEVLPHLTKEYISKGK